MKVTTDWKDHSDKSYRFFGSRLALVCRVARPWWYWERLFGPWYEWAVAIDRWRVLPGAHVTREDAKRTADAAIAALS